MVDSVGGVWERRFKIGSKRASQDVDRGTPGRARCSHVLQAAGTSCAMNAAVKPCRSRVDRHCGRVHRAFWQIATPGPDAALYRSDPRVARILTATIKGMFSISE